jgi:hypothetical protein
MVMMVMVMADEWMATLHTVWSEDGDVESKGERADEESFKAVIINNYARSVDSPRLQTRPWR